MFFFPPPDSFCACSPFSREKFRARIAQERRFPTAWTHSLRRFGPRVGHGDENSQRSCQARPHLCFRRPIRLQGVVSSAPRMILARLVRLCQRGNRDPVLATVVHFSCAISTGHGMDQRPWRCPWFAPGAHLAIIPPPGVIRFGSGRLLFLGRGLPGSYGLNGNRARNLLPNHRPTAIANL